LFLSERIFCFRGKISTVLHQCSTTLIPRAHLSYVRWIMTHDQCVAVVGGGRGVHHGRGGHHGPPFPPFSFSSFVPFFRGTPFSFFVRSFTSWQFVSLRYSPHGGLCTMVVQDTMVNCPLLDGQITLFFFVRSFISW